MRTKRVCKYFEIKSLGEHQGLQQKLIKNIKKKYDKSKESSYLKDQDVNNLYGWAMCGK